MIHTLLTQSTLHPQPTSSQHRLTGNKILTPKDNLGTERQRDACETNFYIILVLWQSGGLSNGIVCAPEFHKHFAMEHEGVGTRAPRVTPTVLRDRGPIPDFFPRSSLDLRNNCLLELAPV